MIPEIQMTPETPTILPVIWQALRKKQKEVDDLTGARREGAQITLDSMMELLPKLPEEKKRLCADYPRVAGTIITDLEWAQRIRTRDHLFRLFSYRRLIACMDPRKDRTYLQMAFGKIGFGDAHIKQDVFVSFWEGLAHKMAAANNAEMAVINGEEVSCSETFFKDYLRGFLTKHPLQHDDTQVALEDRISAVILAINENTKAKEEDRFFPVIKVGEKFEFENPEEFQYILALRTLEVTDPTEIGVDSILYTRLIKGNFPAETALHRLDAIDCFKNRKYIDFRFLLSAIAEIIYDDPFYKVMLIDFLSGVADRIGGKDPVEIRKGFSFSRAILNDFAKYYVKGSGDFRFLEETRKELDRRERVCLYPHRKPVVPADVMEQAFSAKEKKGLSAMNEAIWLGMVPEGSAGSLFPPEMRREIELIINYALKRRKAEAAIIPLVADAFGADSEEALYLMKMMQVDWGAILVKDDGYDLHSERDAEPTLQETEGPADASERALLAMMNIVTELVKRNTTDNRLALAFAQMTTAVYWGDVVSRSLCWDKQARRYNWENPKFLQQYEEAERAIAEIFAWCPLYAGEVAGFPESGALWAEANRDYAYLILVANDMEDILIRGKYKKHEMGNDIGQKPSIYQWLFMHLELPEDDPLSASLAADQEIVRKAYDDIGFKRHAGEKLNNVDDQQIAQACEALTKYASRIIPQMKTMFKPVYIEAQKSLSEAFQRLPARDDRNRIQEMTFRQMIAGVWQKICGYDETAEIDAAEEVELRKLFQINRKEEEAALERLFQVKAPSLEMAER